MICIRSAIVVGGGIAGLTAAIALSKKGVKCTVVERSSQTLGTAISIQGSALGALRELGLRFDADVTDLSAGFGSPSQGPLREAPQHGKLAGFYRPVLFKLLLDEAVRSGVRMEIGKSFVSLHDTGERVEVTCDDGSTADADLVLGADGLSSSVRKALLGEAVRPAYTGQFHLRWMAPGPEIPNRPGVLFSPKGKLLGYPVPQNLIYVVMVVNRARSEHVSDDEAHRIFAEVLESFDHPYVVELRRRLTPEAEIVCRPFDWILVPPPWYRGRVLLIGDAAHATTAHMAAGGGMAIEDGMVLAECVERAGRLEDALELFMKRRWERVKRVVETSAALSKLEQQGASQQEGLKLGAPVFAMLSQPY